jgi:8-oxo-dGTP pyrophosphatase MutT (NUDIX family)
VIVLTDDGRFVLVQEAKDTRKGWWSPPGGMLEPGENVFEAGLREVSEEAAKLPLLDQNTLKWLEMAQSDISILPVERYNFRTI